MKFEDLRNLFSEDIAIAVICNKSLPTDFTLLPEEEKILLNSKSTKRRLEFTLGRAAAVQALSKLNLARSPILKGQRGEPIWPKNVVGSISHSAGQAVAVAKLDKDKLGIGIDIQQYKNLPTLKVFKKILTRNELKQTDLKTQNGQLDALKKFSAKEALYKALGPSLQQNIGFGDISFSPSSKHSNLLIGSWENTCDSKVKEAIPEALCLSKISKEFIFSAVELGASVS